MDNLTLYNKLSALPDHLKSEVGDFIDFLALKSKQQAQKPTPVFGSAKGLIIMHPDFDEPLDDFKEYTT
ncbi:DUF2281 domain-containing protein [Paracnuella aquatica]|uniref:type II toxin-antitoxin system VapB family antitoxin n=1 Tax=Paracnuella aquatica TaxID=2268757 RepID=UPI000DF00E0A|nr:DUF2281 domain-containing protein [Paracnuella aquatica]RPD44221.1 DUF2281 domain-containing protein [Paracnuella aquatica]